MNCFLLFEKLFNSTFFFLNSMFNQLLLKHRYSYLKDFELLFLLKKPKSRIVGEWNRGIEDKDYDDLLNLAIRYEHEECALYALEKGANAFLLPQMFDERGCYLKARPFEFFLINDWRDCVEHVLNKISSQQLSDYEEQWLGESSKMLPIMFKKYSGMPYLNILLKERHTKLFKILLKKYEKIDVIKKEKHVLLMGYALLNASRSELFRIQKLIGWDFDVDSHKNWVQNQLLQSFPKEVEFNVFERIKSCQHIKHLKDKKMLQKEIKSALCVERKVKSL